jgi:hypothetical protein
MNTVTLKSGNTLETQAASFKHAWALTQAIAAELSGDLPEMKSSAMDKEMDMSMVLGAALRLVSSPKVYALLWPCFAPCLYNSLRVSEELFEDEKARQDFLPCVIEIVKLNVLPFMKGLDLSSLTGQAPKPVSQK